MSQLTVCTWNLFHGRAIPDVPRELLPEFAAMLAGWDWDVALLQEVPPWWPEPLAAACGAHASAALTSRNQLLAITRPLARRRPDLMKSWGGGCNAILVRGAPPTAHARRRLRLTPERRVLHAVRLADGTWAGNLHARAHDRALAAEDVLTAARALERWSAPDGGRAVLGGDCNTAEPQAPGWAHAGGNVLDHVFARGLEAADPAKVPPRFDAALGAKLSDHRPVIAALAR